MRKRAAIITSRRDRERSVRAAGLEHEKSFTIMGL
jgi:hypothetical protein